MHLKYSEPDTVRAKAMQYKNDSTEPNNRLVLKFHSPVWWGKSAAISKLAIFFGSGEYPVKNRL